MKACLDLNRNCVSQAMPRPCKAIAEKLIKHYVALNALPRNIASPSSHLSINVRTYVTMNKDLPENLDLDSIFKRKHSLRSQIRKQLKDMDPLARSREDEAVQSIVVEAPWFKECKSLCAYISCASLREVDTSKIVSNALNDPTDGNQSRKNLYVPRVEDKNSNMRMLKISRIDDLVANSMNILEPDLVDSSGNQREDVMQANEPVDLVIIPGLAFDRSGRRLGRGGGYYDLFLKKYQDIAKERRWKRPLLVALSYSLQILEEGTIPVTPCDVLVDAIVTPEGFTLTSSGDET